MRIGMFSNAYKPVISGVVRSIDLFRRGLTEDGHFVGIFAPEGKGYDDTEPFIFRYPSLPLPTEMAYTFPVVVAPQITWLVPRLKLHVIHAHHPFIVGSEAVTFSRTLGVPLVFTFHTMYHEYTHYLGFEAEIVRQIVRRIVGDYVSKAVRVIAPSIVVRDTLPSYGINCPVDILPTPVDLSLFPPRQRQVFSDTERIQLVYVGRIAKEKNLEFLLNAVARALHWEPRLHLRLVGDGPEMHHMRNYAAYLRIGDRVQFVGAVPFDQVSAELLKADLFVFASKTETQGLVVLEAMAAGLPLVLINSPALLEFAQPEVHALVAGDNEGDFAQAILALVADPERARAMGIAARRTAGHYDVAPLTARLLDIYQNAIESYHRTHPA